MRIGRTAAGRSYRKLVNGVWRLCSSCCTAGIAVCGCPDIPTSAFLTITYNSGTVYPGLNGLVIPLAHGPGTGASAVSGFWRGTASTPDGAVWSGGLGDDTAACRIFVSSSSGCSMNDGGVVRPNCSLKTVVADGPFSTGVQLGGFCAFPFGFWTMTVSP